MRGPAPPIASTLTPENTAPTTQSGSRVPRQLHYDNQSVFKERIYLDKAILTSSTTKLP